MDVASALTATVTGLSSGFAPAFRRSLDALDRETLGNVEHASGHDPEVIAHDPVDTSGLRMPGGAEHARQSQMRAVVPQAQIQQALRQDQMRLHYHPIVSLATGAIRGVEALLRWEHPDGGMLMPDDFLPAIAHTPVMQDVTRWVLTTALQGATTWPALTVSVNVTARDIGRPDFVLDVDAALDASGVAPERLVLELTEQAMVQNLDVAIKVLEALRGRGVGLSLDDFGTGYSSLLYLRELPITELKIDRTFLSRVLTSDEDLAIVKSVAKLGRSMGLDVVAEGIETADQARLARSVGCTAGQGFLWGRPCPAGEIDASAVVRIPARATSSSHRGTQPSAEVSTRIHELLGRGASLHTIAAALNSQGVRTDKRTRWTATSVAVAVNALHELPPTS